MVNILKYLSFKKYTPLHTHAISNYIQEIFPVGVFVEGHHFSEINVRGLILY